MRTDWNKHRFSGGLLVFDLVNTVVHRNDAASRLDRFETIDGPNEFALAATRFRSLESGGKAITGPKAQANYKALIDFREIANGYFRPRILGAADAPVTLSQLFAAAATVSLVDDRQFSALRISLGQLSAQSAMKLFDAQLLARCKVCPNCDWLFVDRSKNRSRLWCDMAVCGNRAKAKSHYQRRFLNDQASAVR